MELIEREGFIALLEAEWAKVERGEGRCVFLAGEAGMGKTSLVNQFCQTHRDGNCLLEGTCDALFTPRPLAPLYDIVWQLSPQFQGLAEDSGDRAAFFGRTFLELSKQKLTTLLVFEDIHWADEATFDFIKFLGRRISRLRCLFILTYRDNEIDPGHPLRTILGQLPAHSFTRMTLTPFTREAVEKLASGRGYQGEDVYSISGGNPFYVNEILASYSEGIPDNIKNSVLSVFNQQPGKAKRIWEILSVLPTGLEIKYLKRMEPDYIEGIESSVNAKILLIDEGRIFFKHELYRRTIEASLSPFLRIALNKRILELFRTAFEQKGEIERIIHHAKNANENEIVTRYAPLAAKQAAAVGAHIEARKLYQTAIEYYQKDNKAALLQLYEWYAYECYLTSKNKEAIIYTGKALSLWKEKEDQEKVGNSMRFLSRLWWYEGNGKEAEKYGHLAIEVLKDKPPSKVKAMAYSNMSWLYIAMDKSEERLFWNEKAIAVARELQDDETLSDALNNLGAALILKAETKEKAIEVLNQSLEIALKNGYHEHAAKVYSILGRNGVTIKDYELAKNALEKGINYCEERDLDSQKWYMLAAQARLFLETGHWEYAYDVADHLLQIEDLLPVAKIEALSVLGTIKSRRGDPDPLPLFAEAKRLAYETMELQRIIPVFLALLEYEWVTGKTYIEPDRLSEAIRTMMQLGVFSKKGRFYFWIKKTGNENLVVKWGSREMAEKPGQLSVVNDVDLWKEWGCPYELALALFETDVRSKKKALLMMQGMGATVIYKKMKLDMRMSGIRSIPRGIRETTRANPAHLTSRELEILKLLKDSLQNKEIGEKLFISPKTVDHHISSIHLKLGVTSRGKAVQEAIRSGILK